MWEQGPPPGLYSGTCKWFNIKEGFGFILPDHQHEPELFFHGFHLSSSRVKHKIWPGVELTYDKSVDKKGRPMAINVGYAGSADSWQEARNACRSQRVFDIIKDGAGLAHSDEYATSRYQQQQYTSSMHHVQHQHASLQQHPTAVLGGGSRSASWNRAMGVSLEDAHYMQQLQVAQVQQQQVQVAAAVAQQAAVQQVAAVAAQQPALVAQQPVLVAQQAAQQAAAVAQVAQVQQAQQAAAVAQAAVQQGAAVAAAQVAQVAAQQQIAMAASPTAVQQQQQMFAQQAQQRHLYHQQQQQLAAQHHFLYACQQAEQQQQQQQEEHADNAAEGGEEADGDSPPTPPPRQQQPALVAADDGVPTPPAPATQAQPLCAPRQRPTSFPSRSSPSPPSEGLRTAADGHGEGASSQDTAAVVPSSTSSQDTGASMLSPTSVCSAGDASGDRDFGADGDVALKDLQQLRLPPRRAFGANKVESEPVPTLTLPFGGAESSAGGVAGVGSNGEHSAPPQATAIRRSHSAWGAHSGRHGHGGGRPYPTHPTTALTAPDARARALARIEQQGAAQQQRMHSHGAMAHAPPRIPHRRTASSGAKVDVSRSHGSGHPAAVGPPLTGCADPGFAVKRATSGPLFGAGKVGWFQRSASLFSDSGRSPGDAEPPEQLSRPISRFAAARVASDESSTHSPGVQRAQPTLFGSVPNSMDYM
uniref:CSD domain-containing protein n=1 Tax=Prasinoderma singulare TaxID=676789 RepID=A0A7S3BTE2_9VIRI